MMTRTLVATLFVVGIMVAGTHGSTYVQDFEGLSAGTDITTLPEWAAPDGSPGVTEVSTEQAASGSKSLKVLGTTNHLDLLVSTALGFSPEHPKSGLVTFKYDYWVQSVGAEPSTRGQIIYSSSDVGVTQAINTSFTGKDAASELILGGAGPWLPYGLPSHPIAAQEWTTVTVTLDLDNEEAVVNIDSPTTGNNTSDVVPFQTGEQAWQSGDPLGLIYITYFDGGPAYFDNIQLTGIPEPATLGLLGIGGLFAVLRRRK